MAQITLLDGSIGLELIKRSNDRIAPLRSTQVLIDHPDLVGDVHRDYFEAGTTLATANTIHHSRPVRVGLEDKHGALLEAAMTQANQARDAAGCDRIAGSLGPLLASYRPDLDPDLDDAAEKFGIITKAIAPHCYLLLIETVFSPQRSVWCARRPYGLWHPGLDRVLSRRQT